MKPACDTREKLLHVALRLVWEASYGSVSVDDICRQAGVKKGSFYYFFPSKSDLTAAAMQMHWEEQKADLDAIFSPQRTASERISAYCDYTRSRQAAKREQYGKVCGCPMVTLGAELSTQDETIRRKTAEIMDGYVAYFASAARDLPGVPDPIAVGRCLFAYSQGLLLQAKVHNDLSPLNELKPGMLRFLEMQS